MGTSERGTTSTRVRRQQMLALIRAQDFARINDLSDRFGVSIVTIRNDLDELAQGGQIRRVRGGAVPRILQQSELPYEAREDDRAVEKALIAKAAVGLLSPGDSVILDVGTTSMAIAHELAANTDLTDVTVLTWGLNIALALEMAIPRMQVIVTGGILRPLQHSLVDSIAGLVLDRVRVSVALVASNAVHPVRGVMTTNLPESAMKQKMLSVAQRRVLVVDSSKFGQEALAHVCDLGDLDLIITAGKPDEKILAVVRESVEVMVVDEASAQA